MMKFLNINATINVKPQFDGEVLKAGTPLDVSGAIANSDAAVGLVANDTAKGAESIAIVTEGSIDLTEVAASYGEALTDDCIAALKGITFLYGGKAVVPSSGGVGNIPDTCSIDDNTLTNVYVPLSFRMEGTSDHGCDILFDSLIYGGNYLDISASLEVLSDNDSEVQNKSIEVSNVAAILRTKDYDEVGFPSLGVYAGIIRNFFESEIRYPISFWDETIRNLDTDPDISRIHFVMS